MACILVAGTSSRQSCTVILHRFADSKVVGEARFPHPLTAPQSEQNSAFWGDALIGARKQLQSDLDQVAAIPGARNGYRLVSLDQNYAAEVTDCFSGLIGATFQRCDSLTLHHAHHCLRNDRRLGLGDDLARSRKFRQPFVDSIATPFGLPCSGGMRRPVLGY